MNRHLMCLAAYCTHALTAKAHYGVSDDVPWLEVVVAGGAQRQWGLALTCLTPATVLSALNLLDIRLRSPSCPVEDVTALEAEPLRRLDADALTVRVTQTNALDRARSVVQT